MKRFSITLNSVQLLESSFGSIKHVCTQTHLHRPPWANNQNPKRLHYAKGHSISTDNTMLLHLLAGFKCIKMPYVKSDFFIMLSLQTKHLRADKSFNDQPLLFSTTEKKHLLESRGHKSQTFF